MRDHRNELIKVKRHKRFILRQEKDAKKRRGRATSRRSSRREGDEWSRQTPAKLIKRGLAVVRVPETFSFIENPIETLSALDDLHAAIADASVHEIFIDFGKCKTLDLCASTVMTVMVLKATRRRSRKRKSFALRGNYPAGERAKILLQGSGLLKYLKTTAEVLPLSIQSKLIMMELRSGFSRRPEKSAKCDQATTSLVEYVNSCLAKTGATLTGFGNQSLGILIGETIANAEEHSDGTWYATAHFDRLDPNVQEGGACHIVLMNFGATISDSFSLPDSDKHRAAQLQALAKRHDKRQFFDVRPRSYDAETLFTLYALQEGVSRRPDRRGIGTTLLIDFFLKLSAPQAKMCVVSGKAFILFDGTYPLRAVQFEDGSTRRIIAFNKENSLEERPDDNYVWSLPEEFPGTLISLRFNLKKDYVVADEGTEVTVCPLK
jgi:hypothetical protein